jgi:hypothetical protein
LKATRRFIALTLAATLTLGSGFTVFADYNEGGLAPPAEGQEADALAALAQEPDAASAGFGTLNAIIWDADPSATGSGANDELAALSGDYGTVELANDAAGTLIVPVGFELTIVGDESGGAALTVQIPGDSTVIWQAEYDIATGAAAVTVTQTGTFRVGPDGSIEHTGTTGSALLTTAASTLEIQGSVEAEDIAISIGDNTELIVMEGANVVSDNRAISGTTASDPDNVTIQDFHAVDGAIHLGGQYRFMVGFDGNGASNFTHVVHLTDDDDEIDYVPPTDLIQAGFDFVSWMVYSGTDAGEPFDEDAEYDEHTLVRAVWEPDGTGNGGEAPIPLPTGVESVSLSRDTLPHTGGNVVVTIGFNDSYFDPNDEDIYVYAGGDGLFAAMVYPFNNPEGTADVYGRAVVTFLHQNTTEYPINYQLYMFVARPTTTSPNAGTNYRLGDYGVRLLPAPETMPFVGPSFQRNVDPAGAAQFAQLRPGTSPLPGTPAHSFTSGVASSTRVMQGIVANPPAVVTADGLIGDIRAVLPAGVTAEWSANTPFTVRDGQATGLIIITIGNFRTAIVVDLPTADAE